MDARIKLILLRWSCTVRAPICLLLAIAGLGCAGSKTPTREFVEELLSVDQAAADSLTLSNYLDILMEEAIPLHDTSYLLQVLRSVCAQQDTARIRFMIAQSRRRVSSVLELLVYKGMSERAAGDTTAPSLSCAQFAADIFGELFDTPTLPVHISRYADLDRADAQANQDATDRLNDAVRLFDEGQHEEASDVLLEVNEIFTLQRDAMRHARCALYLGKYARTRGRDWEDAALKVLEYAANLFYELGNERDTAASVGEAGRVHMALGNVGHAKQLLEFALEVAEKHGDAELQLHEALALGRLGLQTDEIAQAWHYLRFASLKWRENERLQDVPVGLEITEALGELYLEVGLYDDALGAFEVCLRDAQAKEDRVHQVVIHVDLGNVYQALDDNHAALVEYEAALALVEGRGTTIAEGLVQLNICTVLRKIEGDSAALKCFLEAEAKTEDVGNVMSFGSIGQIYLALGDYVAAVEALGKATEPGAPYTKHSQSGLAGLLAEALWKAGRVEDAERVFEEAIGLIDEELRRSAGLRQELRWLQVAGKRGLVDRYVEFLLHIAETAPDSNHAEQAFSVAESAKSRLFQGFLAKARARRTLKEESSAKELLEYEDYLFGVLSGRPDPAEWSEDSSERQAAELLLRNVERELERTHPLYRELKNADPLTMSQAQALLGPREALVSYLLGHESSVVFVVTPRGFSTVKIGAGRERIEALVRGFRQGLSDVSEFVELEQFDPQLAHELYVVLFAPIVEHLEGISDVYISGDGLLHTVPFEALVDRPVDERAFAAARERGRRSGAPYLGEYGLVHFLIESFAFSYLPSVRVLSALRGHQDPEYGNWSRALIAFADPQMDGDHELRGRTAGSWLLPRLSATAEEARTIAQIVGGNENDIYLRERASEKSVYEADLESARFLLFATHGLTGQEATPIDEPALVLVPEGVATSADGFLTASEVMNLELSCELVVLSACDSDGRGPLGHIGEGFAGLTQSFMYAGARSVLVTLWDVEDLSSGQTVSETFRRMMQDEGVSVALREAKRATKASTFHTEVLPEYPISRQHPYFWAPFVLVGERGGKSIAGSRD